MTTPTGLDDLIAADAYCRFLGVRTADRPGPGALEAAPDSSAHPLAVHPDLLLEADDRHFGNERARSLHGGVVAGFLETAARLHIHADLGRPARTLTFACEFLREAKAGEVRARTEILRRGRRLAVARVTAWQDDPLRPVASGHGSFAVWVAPDGETT
jgi:uncharacterized protein (TIGR00369 family)